MLGYATLLVALLAGTTSQDVWGWSVRITPEYLSSPVGSVVVVLCEAEVALDACEMMVLHGNSSHLALDLRPEHMSLPVSALDQYEERLFHAAYHGEGLARGHCGIQLTPMQEGGFVVGCRARELEGGWRRGTMTLYAQKKAERHFGLSLERREAVVAEGDDAVVFCDAGEPLGRCDGVWLGADSTLPSGSDDLKRGACSVEAVRVHSAGPAWCVARALDGATAARAAFITVARAPKYPVLVLATGTNYVEGATLAAMCVVHDAAPPPVVTWYLGEAVVRSDAQADVARGPWAWPWEAQPFAQTLLQKLRLEDNEKEIRCSVEHVTWQGARQSKRKIFVQDRHFYDTK